MTPEEADHAEALRRIQEAAQTRAAQLDLRELRFLKRLPPELERLTSLQTLDLSYCEQLSGDLSLLAGLSSLQTLNLSQKILTLPVKRNSIPEPSWCSTAKGQYKRAKTAYDKKVAVALQ